ncbi:MAG: OB-fold domain-containing protein [Candidatus Rokubacteria bacterium]|nr:OB-fold domain-containing protein [Candidatus Rokubacteria bacterium]
MIESIAGSRCPRCGLVVAPAAVYCPRHPVAMVPESLRGVGEIVTFTTLHSPPEGFRSPLDIALVELEGGARFVCHGAGTSGGLKIGSVVGIEALDKIYYFSHLGTLDRARLFWRRAGRAGDRVNAMTRSVVKRLWRSRASQDDQPPHP